MSSQLATQSSSYNTAFRALLEKTGNAEPSWLRRMREDSFAHFERVGFPSVKEEEWKYTNVAPIAKLQFVPAFANGQPGGLSVTISIPLRLSSRDAINSQTQQT